MPHEKGYKGKKDRALLIASYKGMAKEFKLPRGEALSDYEIAKMTNAQLFQASADLYNAQPIKKVHRLAVKLGLVPALPRWYVRAANWLRNTAILLSIRVRAKGRKVAANG